MSHILIEELDDSELDDAPASSAEHTLEFELLPQGEASSSQEPQQQSSQARRSPMADNSSTSYSLAILSDAVSTGRFDAKGFQDSLMQKRKLEDDSRYAYGTGLAKNLNSPDFMPQPSAPQLTADLKEEYFAWSTECNNQQRQQFPHHEEWIHGLQSTSTNGIKFSPTTSLAELPVDNISLDFQQYVRSLAQVTPQEIKDPALKAFLGLSQLPPSNLST